MDSEFSPAARPALRGVSHLPQLHYRRGRASGPGRPRSAGGGSQKSIGLPIAIAIADPFSLKEPEPSSCIQHFNGTSILLC